MATSTLTWLPGLKMVRRLSRVGTRSIRSSKDSRSSPRGSTNPNPSLLDPPNDSSHDPSPSHHSRPRSKTISDPPPHHHHSRSASTQKSIMGRMNRQTSAIHPTDSQAQEDREDRELGAQRRKRTTRMNPSSNSIISLTYHQSNLKRVFMKRHRSSPTTHHDHPDGTPHQAATTLPTRSTRDGDDAVVSEKENCPKDLDDDVDHHLGTRTTDQHPTSPTKSSTIREPKHHHHHSHPATTYHHSPHLIHDAHPSLHHGFGSMFKSIMRLTPFTDSSSSSSPTPTTTTSID